jgi:autotransporter-associated beta strand protein
MNKPNAMTFYDAASPRLLPRALIVALLLLLLLLLSTRGTIFAGSATWKTSPNSGDWNAAGNWTPSTIPNGPSETATFASSNTTDVFLSANTEVNGIAFNAGASAFTITASPTFSLTISGVGITNNSGIAQNFVAAVNQAGGNGTISFTNSATAGSQTVFTINGDKISGVPPSLLEFFDSSTAGNGTFITNGPTANGIHGGETHFFDTSTADNATFTNNGGTLSGISGSTRFFNSSTAGNATFINNGGSVGGANGGATVFNDSSNAGNATITNKASTGGNGGQTFFGGASSAGNCTIINDGGGGITTFTETSTPAQATLIAMPGQHRRSGGRIVFQGSTIGSTARVQLFGIGKQRSASDGTLDLSQNFVELTVRVGSIEGNGVVILGQFNLTVGSNNLNTTFSGVITGNDGSLTKVGTGTLILRNANTYTGGTTINGGKLVINNKSGSGTGTGVVQVNAGRLGGRGIIAGAVTIGDGSGQGAVLSPGNSAVTRGTLTVQSGLTFNPDAIYNFWLNTDNTTADKVVALGVTIHSGAQFSFADRGGSALTPGTVFTVIDNTAATPIAGNFSNLADGSTFTSNGNNYQVSYEGGDGNDLTLAVVP